MKKLTTMVAAIAMLSAPLFASTGNASKEKSSKKISITQVRNGVFDLNITSVEPGKVDVQIYSDNGNLIHQDQFVYKNSIKVPFDLSNLSEGNYKFVIKGKEVDDVQDVFVSKLNKKDVAAIVKKIDDHRVKVTVFHEENTPVSITLIDKKGNTYFKETQNTKSNFSRVFDLAKVEETDLLLQVQGKKSSITKSL